MPNFELHSGILKSLKFCIWHTLAIPEGARDCILKGNVMLIKKHFFKIWTNYFLRSTDLKENVLLSSSCQSTHCLVSAEMRDVFWLSIELSTTFRQKTIGLAFNLCTPPYTFNIPPLQEELELSMKLQPPTRCKAWKFSTSTKNQNGSINVPGIQWTMRDLPAFRMDFQYQGVHSCHSCLWGQKDIKTSSQ